ncbi:MAG TPA: family 43 glycosylhydrolase [Kofleriaceae bacterium]|nr:family 43 glycosylhydrolase [Kofleriaceae bacterium]
MRGETADGSDASISGSLAVGTLHGPWRIEYELGRGAMGIVYAVTHEHIGKRAALKVLHRTLGVGTTKYAERMLLEARVVNAIAHPNIVDIFDVGATEDGRPYIVMERVDGCALGDAALDRADALEVLGQIADALGAAHAVGVVHRDIKPDNILLVCSRDGAVCVKLVDWGIARMLNSDVRHTFEGQIVGTPLYLSPEQACGAPVTAQTDVYSLGVVAYELLLGEPPFRGATREVMAKHLWVEPRDPRTLWPEIPDALASLLLAMLAKAPEARPVMTSVAATIAAARIRRGDETPAEALEPSSSESELREAVARRALRPNQMFAIVAGAALIGAIALIVAVTRASSEGRAVPKVAVPSVAERAPAEEPVAMPTAPQARRSPVVTSTRATTAPAQPSGVVENCPDPSLLRDGAEWVMVCTGRHGDDIYPMHVSSDLRSWRDAGFIFTAATRPTWADGNYWSPEVRRTSDGYAAYFSMRVSGARNAIGVATSQSARGPFVDRGEPLYAPRDGASDPDVFLDGGRTFLFQRRNTPHATLWVQELAADATPVGDARQVLAPSEEWEQGNVQVPAVIRRGDYVYLFYSGATYCDRSYAIGVARSRSPLGPFEKMRTPLVQSNDEWLGPGHASVAMTGTGEYVIAYHGYRASEGEPSCVRGANGDNNARHARVERLTFENGWPRLRD